MAQMPDPVASAPRVAASNDIYTALTIISTAVVLAAIGFVLYRTNELMGTPFPGFSG